ncbi:MAG TPA: MarR family transcriptional regulator [Lachnospiraceae bacterium]|mgnify:CR=1 FL=1|nr:MarR family transcriptional regulator [Lachnospiraceae bacterium]
MHELMSRFSIIHRQSSIYLDHRLKEHHITGSQYTHILVICENPGISQEEISDKLKIDKGSVARMIKQFASEHYITRLISKEDKRQYQIYPTDKAKAVYEKIHGTAVASENRLTKGFTDVERDILINLLDKIITNLEE